MNPDDFPCPLCGLDLEADPHTRDGFWAIVQARKA